MSAGWQDATDPSTEGKLLAHWVQTRLPTRPPERQAALVQSLQHYLDLLTRWNATYNLTAVRERGAMLRQHLADCLAVVEPVRQHLESICSPGRDAAPRILDVGSGGGLPGLVLALALPQVQVTCLDTVAKKVAFVRQSAAELGLQNLHAVHGRIERWQAPPFDLITARAFATLVDLTSLSRHLLKPSGVWMAMKGRTPEAEITALPNSLEVFHVEPLEVPELAAQRCLVWIRQRPEASAPLDQT